MFELADQDTGQARINRGCYEKNLVAEFPLKINAYVCLYPKRSMRILLS